jgi:putative transposase
VIDIPYSSRGKKRMSPLTSRPRLKEFSYCGQFAYFVTLATTNREPLFEDSITVNLVRKVLVSLQIEGDFLILAYCFMPDHLHLLLQGISDGSNLIKFIKFFKQRSGFGYKNMMGKPLWQPSYYDHVLRKEEDLLEIARYIWNNPVRAGLVSSPHDYPYSGSFTYDWNGIE